MDVSAFEQIASSLTVKAICAPLGPDVSEWTFLGELEEHLHPGDDPNLDPWHNPSRVVDRDGNTIGMLWFEDYVGEPDFQHYYLVQEHEGEEEEEELDPTVERVMTRIEPSQILSSTTTILDAIELFGTNGNELFYILHINEIIGVLRFEDIFHPLGRLAILALALEIEGQALKLCRSNKHREQCWLSNSDRQKRRAIKTFKQREGREPCEPQQKGFLRDLPLLIDCTHLMDKAVMLWRQKLIPAATRAEVLGFFDKLNTIRNRCAHPGGDRKLLLHKEELGHFIHSAQRMRLSLHEAMQAHGVGSRREPISFATFLDEIDDEHRRT